MDDERDRQAVADPALAPRVVGPEREPDLAIGIGLAMRRHRRDLGLNQRSYAVFRGWSKGRQHRLESLAGELRLDGLVLALRGTGFRLALVHDNDSSAGQGVGIEAGIAAPARGDIDAGAAAALDQMEIVQPHEWADTEFIARDSAGRRFPAHKQPYRTVSAPNWWLWRYSTSRCDSPRWSAAGWDPRVVEGWRSLLGEGGLDDPGASDAQVSDG